VQKNGRRVRRREKKRTMFSREKRDGKRVRRRQPNEYPEGPPRLPPLCEVRRKVLVLFLGGGLYYKRVPKNYKMNPKHYQTSPQVM
jgi:hypothetical protein